MSLPNNILLNGDVDGYLTSNIDGYATSISLYSINVGWNQVIGQSDFTFVVRVDNELMVVTAVTGTLPNLTLTVVRDTDNFATAYEDSVYSPHNKGARLYHVISGYTLNTLYKQAVNGTLLAATNTINFIPHGLAISIANNPEGLGSNIHFQVPLNYDFGVMKVPPLTGWTQLAQADSATLAEVDFTSTGISLTQTASTSATHRVQAISLAYPNDANVYHFKGLFSATPSATSKAGIFVGDSATGKMFCCGYQYGQTGIQTWTYSNSNTLTTSYGVIADPKIHHNRMFLGIAPGGGSFIYSADNAYYQSLGYGESDSTDYTSYFGGSGPDQFGFWIDTSSGDLCSFRCVHFL